MGIIIRRLSAHGLGIAAAEIEFDSIRTLIRGPSDTGKSYIFDCIWYLLGGTAAPEIIPESTGYLFLELAFSHSGHEYVVRKSIRGGEASVFLEESAYAAQAASGEATQNLSELLVKLSGAEGKQVLRSRSERGPVTGDDLRHWALLSQPSMISKEATSGGGHSATKRIASFSLFLTGNDDSEIVLYKTPSDLDQATGKIALAEAELNRIQAGIPPNVDRISTLEALEKVDEHLELLNSDREVRSLQLRELRQQIASENERLRVASTQYSNASTFLERFDVLREKYASDLARLNGADEAAAFFSALEEVPCPLCGTSTDLHVDKGDFESAASSKYREAINAESKKILELQLGLTKSQGTVLQRLELAEMQIKDLTQSLEFLEAEEKNALRAMSVNFDFNPRQLAEEHTLYYSRLTAFDESARLMDEISRLKQEKTQKRIPLLRDPKEHGTEVGEIAREMLIAWGFTDIKSVLVDGKACDLIVNGRRRLSYGAGKRGIFRTALTIALMRYALAHGHPHLGVVVLDSPLKAYAQRDSEDDDIPTATVNECFYRWLSVWEGPGQVIVLENEAIDPAVASRLKVTEFTDSYTSGRQGFYPSNPYFPSAELARLGVDSARLQYIGPDILTPNSGLQVTDLRMSLMLPVLTLPGPKGK